MARKGLISKSFQPTDPELSRFVGTVKDAVDQLAKDHDVWSSPVVRMVTGGVVAPEAAIVAYVGGPLQTIILPPAAGQGTNTGQAITVVNTSTSAVTIQRTVTDTINGGTSITLNAGSATVLASDGISKWLAILPGTAGAIGAKGADGNDADVSDLEWKLRRFLADYKLRLGLTPPGLEHDAALGLAEMRG